MNIYEIPEAYENAYLAATDEETGEVDEGKLGELLAAVEGEIDEKLQRLGEWYKDLVAEEDAIDAEIKSLRARKEAKAAKADRVKRYISYALGLAGRRKFEAATVALSFRTAKRTDIIDATKIPPEFMRTKITKEPDKTLIAKCIDGGEDVPGAVRVSYDSLTVK
jgi:hypothetical protein